MKKLIAIIIGIGMIVQKIKNVIAWGVDKWAKISPMVQPIIKEVEAAAADGTISLSERKKIAMSAIASAEKQGVIKLNWITRWVLGIIVDKVAQKLPDIEVSKLAPGLVAGAVKESRI